MAYLKPEQIGDYEKSPEWLKKWIRVFGHIWPYDNRDYWGDLVFSHKIQVMSGDILESDSDKELTKLLDLASKIPERIIRNRVNPLRSSLEDLIYTEKNAAAWKKYEDGTLVDSGDVAEWYGQQLLSQESNNSENN